MPEPKALNAEERNHLISAYGLRRRWPNHCDLCGFTLHPGETCQERAAKEGHR